MTRHIKLERTFRVSGVLIWAIEVEREFKAHDEEDAALKFETMGDNGEFREAFTSREQPYSPELADLEVEMLEGIA